MPLHTCDRTRADGLSTPLKGSTFLSEKKLASRFGIIESIAVDL